jgi:hypothetical protein
MPAEYAVVMAEDYLRRQKHNAHAKSLQIWASSLGIYAMGGKPPDPPTFDED